MLDGPRYGYRVLIRGYILGGDTIPELGPDKTCTAPLGGASYRGHSQGAPEYVHRYSLSPASVPHPNRWGPNQMCSL